MYEPWLLLCRAGEVALSRAADEESLQILHVWRGGT
jgi:hypothetical protein